MLRLKSLEPKDTRFCTTQRQRGLQHFLQVHHQLPSLMHIEQRLLQMSREFAKKLTRHLMRSITKRENWFKTSLELKKQLKNFRKSNQILLHL